MADIEKFATVSSKGQFTLPSEFRKAMGIDAGTQVKCVMFNDELRVRVVHIEKHERDPVLAQFMDLIDQDITQNGHLFEMPEDIAVRMQAASLEDVDLDEEIEGDIEL